MKVSEVLETIDRSKENECYFFFTDIAFRWFGLGDIDECMDSDNQDRLKAYWIKKWTSHYHEDFGYLAYLLDGELMAISSILERNVEEVKWVYKSSYNKVRSYLLEFSCEKIDVIDAESEFDNLYKVMSCDELTEYEKENAICVGKHQGTKGKIIATHVYAYETAATHYVEVWDGEECLNVKLTDLVFEKQKD